MLKTKRRGPLKALRQEDEMDYKIPSPVPRCPPREVGALQGPKLPPLRGFLSASREDLATALHGSPCSFVFSGGTTASPVPHLTEITAAGGGSKLSSDASFAPAIPLRLPRVECQAQQVAAVVSSESSLLQALPEPKLPPLVAEEKAETVAADESPQGLRMLSGKLPKLPQANQHVGAFFNRQFIRGLGPRPKSFLSQGCDSLDC